MTASILPPAETTFFDNDGIPLALGYVYTYVPGTTTPKSTWQDFAATILNTNPTRLDAAGRCIMLGTGAYRTIVKDVDLNTIWDEETANSPISTAMLPIVSANTIPIAEGLWEQGITDGSAPPGPLLGQRWIDNSVPTAPVMKVYDGADWMTSATWDTVNHVWVGNGAIDLEAPPVVDTIPIAQSGNHMHATGAITTTTNGGTVDAFGLAINVTNNTGVAASIATARNNGGIYCAVETTATGGNAWAVNGLILIDSGAAAIGAQQICEWDIANFSGIDYGDGLGFTGIIQPSVFGHQTTGAGPNRVTAAHVILGNTPGPLPLWNNGLVSGPLTIRQNFLADYSSATRSYLLSGAHTYGIDFAGQTGEGANPAIRAIISDSAIRFGAQDKVSWRNQADSANLRMLQSTSTDQLYFAQDATQLVMWPLAIILPALLTSTSYANDAAAQVGGVALGQLYRNGSVVQIRVT